MGWSMKSSSIDDSNNQIFPEDIYDGLGIFQKTDETRRHNVCSRLFLLYTIHMGLGQCDINMI